MRFGDFAHVGNSSNHTASILVSGKIHSTQLYFFSVENTDVSPCYFPWYILFNKVINANALLGLCFSVLSLNYLSISPQIVYLEFHLWSKCNCLIV